MNNELKIFDELINQPKDEQYILKLCITGLTRLSTKAIENAKKFCEKHLAGRYELDVIDIYQQPELAKAEQLLAAPTLIKSLPLPRRRIIGDLSDETKVLTGLGIV